MEEDKTYYDYYESISPYNVLVVSNDGEIIDLLCPFQVKSKVNFPTINNNDKVWVQKVQTTAESKDVFIIEDNAYYVEHFSIILQENKA